MKTNKYILVACLAAILIMVNSCYYDEVVNVEQPGEEVGTVLFSEDIIPIFNKDCNTSGCHNGTVSPNLLSANAYNALINGGYVDTSAPENSKLYLWMKGSKGTPMPVSGANATYNSKVLAWIKQGALNN